MTRPDAIKEIFNDALDLSPREREDFLDRACGSDVELRGQVERLLKSHRTATDFLCAATDVGLNPLPVLPSSDHTRFADRSARADEDEAANQSIDRYRLLRRIGE